jgi:hypothetical protein
MDVVDTLKYNLPMYDFLNIPFKIAKTYQTLRPTGLRCHMLPAVSLTLPTGGQLVIDTAGNKRKLDLKVKYTNRLYITRGLGT